MRKVPLIIFLLAFILSFFNLYSQKDPIRDEFFDAEFFLAEEQYSEALQAYIKVFNAGNQENSNINYRIGECYMNIPGEKTKAIPYLENAARNISSSWREGNYRETTAPLDTWLFLGNAYRIDQQLDKAIESYNKFIELNARGKDSDNEFARQQIQASYRAKEAVLSPAVVTFENLGRRFNSNQNNFQPVFSGDGNSMAFMNSLRFYDAVYFARKVNNSWTNTINITPQIESDGDQYVTALSYDGRTMYLVRVSNYIANIHESEFISGRWTKSRPLDKTINTKYFESHASISPDGNTLYFTSNRAESLGGMDIFMSEKDASGKWTLPVNLGSVVNTPFNEESPYMSNDGKTLFFSSQGHESIGGYDIFYTVKQDDGSWSKPVALPYPVNTTDDDLYFYPVDNGKGGYISLFKNDGFGSGDIYFVDLDPEIEVAEITETIPDEKTDTVISPIPDEPAEEKPVETLKYLIKPIYFDFDRYSLSDAAIEKLDLITDILRDYPEMKLEVRGHTDAIGTNQYNQTLSERRARTVTNYLISKGIDPDRLPFKGLSMSEPAASNRRPDGTDSPEGRRFNRRVEFRVLVIPQDIIIIQESEVPENLKIN
jgi:outer membrane protein OmpA-like peptidoglycan-associated protein